MGLLDFFKERRVYLTDELRWEAFMEHGGERKIVKTEDGAWFISAEIRGPDMDYRSTEARFRLMSLVNNVVRLKGSNHAFWFEEQNLPCTDYYELAPRDDAAWLFEAEREHLFRHGRRHYTTRAFMTLLYRPPKAMLDKLTQKLIDYDPDGDPAHAYALELERFVAAFDELLDGLTMLPVRKLLVSDGLWSYLHSTISGHIQEVAATDWDEALPGPLVDQPFLGGFRPTLGEGDDGKWELWPITVHNYPRYLEGALLRALRDIPVRWRRASRWFPIDHHEADKEISRAWSRASLTRKPPMVATLGALGWQGDTVRTNPASDEMMLDAHDASNELRRGLVTRGYITNTVTVMVPAEEGQGRHWAREVAKRMRQQKLVVTIESLNAAETILGSIPGQLWHDVTRHGVNSAAACCFFPIEAPWLGTPKSERFGTPALLRCTRGGCTPFDLDLHVGDVGHFLVTGWTGGGKSTLGNAITLAHRARHPNGRIFRFDKGRSSKVVTLALGGRFVDPMRDNQPMQPLRYVDTPADIVWAFGWIRGLAADVDPEKAKCNEVKDDITEALHQFRDTVDPDRRTLSLFMATVQNWWLKGVLKPYTAGGIYGSVFDGVDARSWDDPVVTVEMGDCLNDKLLSAPLASFLFHVLRRGAGPDTPTLGILDEGHNFMRHPFLEPLEAVVREGRGGNIQIGMLSQNIRDFARSDVEPIFMSNCPSRLFIPDPDALEAGSADILENYGLRSSEIRCIAESIPKKQYAYQRKGAEPGTGFAIIDLELGEVGRALCATTNTLHQAMADRVLRRWGQDDFLYGWLLECGLPDAAAALPRQPSPLAAAE